MATVFYDGMPNVNEKLNELYTAFAAGPYNAVPLTGGTMTGPLANTTTISAEGSITSLSRLVGQKIHAGVQGSNPAQNVIARPDATEGQEILSLPFCGDFFKSMGGLGNPAATSLSLSKNSTTNRSITTPGTVNANGADYAEYLIKRTDCGQVSAGQIIGIDGEGKITDRWELALMFAVKSTNPSLVGGDTWWQHLGPRPQSPMWTVGTTDAQWAAMLAEYTKLALAYNDAYEDARSKADRIAFCGQVPVNLLGGQPGQYLLPAQDGTSISGIFVDEADLTLPQYMRALGRVVAVEADGRSRIIVKVV